MIGKQTIQNAAITYLKYVAAIIIAVVGGVAFLSVFLSITLLPFIVAYLLYGIQPFNFGVDGHFGVQLVWIGWFLLVILPAFFALVDWSEGEE